MAKTMKAGFRESYQQYLRIMDELAGGTCRKLYVLMGEESFFIDRIADFIAEHAVPDEMKPFNQTVLYGNSAGGGEVISLCRQYPMMGDRSVVIVRDAQNLSDLGALVHYVKEPLATTVLVLCHREGMIDKRSALYKSFASLGGEAVVFESVPPREYEVDGWIGDTVRRKGFAIDAPSVQMLVQYLGADLAKIDNELDKLMTALPQGTKRIVPADIENYIGISKDYNNFELTKALSEHDVRKALLIARHFAQSQKQNPYVVTIQMLHTHFYRIFNLALLLWTAQKKRKPAPSEVELARALQLPSPFFLKEYMQALKYYNSQKAFTILGLIREYDLRGKGVEQGSADPGELLEELILKITML